MEDSGRTGPELFQQVTVQSSESQTKAWELDFERVNRLSDNLFCGEILPQSSHNFYVTLNGEEVLQP